MKFLIGLFTSFAGVATMETDFLLGAAISMVALLLMFGGIKAINEMEYV